MGTVVMKDKALELAGLGWHLIPLWGVEGVIGGARLQCRCPKGATCPDAGKHPLARLVPQGLKQASADAAVVADWWDAEPDANIGVVAGPSNLLIIDIDGLTGMQTWQRLESAAIHAGDALTVPDTFTVATGRMESGYHLYFALPEGALGTRSNITLAEDLQTRHGGGYVVGPGSLHASGRRYDVLYSGEVAVAPEWLLEALRAVRPAASRLADLAGEGEGPFQVPHGQGNTWLTMMAGAQVRHGVRGTALFAILWALNVEHMRDAPMSADAVRKIADSVGRYPADAEAVMRALDPTGADMTGLIELAGEHTHDERGGDGTTERVAGHSEVSQAQTDIVLRAGATDEDYADVVEALAGDGGVLWVQGMGWAAWDGTRWHLDVHGAGECVIRDWLADAALILSAVQGQGREGAVKRAARLRNERTRGPGLKRLALRHHLRVTPDEFDRNDDLVGLADGRVIELEAGGGHRVRAAVQADRVTRHLAEGAVYDPDAVCELWEAFLARVLPDPEMRAYLQRWAGYLLTGHTTEQCFAVLLGGGSNGKSTVVDTLLAVLGATADGGYGHELLPGAMVASAGSAGEQSSIAQLRGARFAVSVEPKKGGLLNEELIKQATGDERLTAKYMGRDPFSFTNRAKLFFATNHPPAVGGTDQGIWRRVRRIPFDVEIPDAEQDKELGHKLRGGGGDWAGELPGILAWMLRGYSAWKQGGLATPAAVIAETEAYRRSEDTFGAFFEDNYELDPSGVSGSGWYVRVTEVAEACETWLRAHDPGSKAMSAKAIGAEMRARNVGVIQITEPAGKRVRAYVGIRAVVPLRRTGELEGVPSVDDVLNGAA